MSLSEVRSAKASLNAEIGEHAVSIKRAEKLLQHAEKEKERSTKDADRALTKAQKDHLAAVKAATKQFEATQKEQLKAIDIAKKADSKARQSLASYAPAPELETA